ncbi:XRE family transcriptional regulator [Candidatus Binatus soli]|jgi:transcriptional regulator with XRE-family HTH domain|uniref:XRE family transcriptional regulator n=1 Tax=Candidatus Binatus soli TaxID=1953413 RepID=UPI003D1530C1
MPSKAHKPKRRSPKVAAKDQTQTREAMLTDSRRIAVSEFAARLKEAISGRSITAIAAELGVSRTAFHDWIAGRAAPDVITTSRLASELDISIEWLMTGRGDMRAGAAGYIVPAWPNDRAPVLFELDWFRKNIGQVSVPDDVRNAIGSREYEEAFPPLLFEVRADDSMEPTLRKGDLLLAGTIEIDSPMNGLYLIARKGAEPGERLFPRRVEWSGNSIARLKCDNTAYPTVIEISKSNDKGLLIYARVIWHGRIL